MLKRRFVSLLLTLIMAMSFIPSAYAEDEGDVFEILSLHEGSSYDSFYSWVDIQNLTSVDQTGVLMVASYSADGQFLSYSCGNISIPANENVEYLSRFKSTPSVYCKAFIWDGMGTLKPIAQTLSKEFPTTIRLDAERYVLQSTLPDYEQYHPKHPYISFENYIAKVTDALDIYVNGYLYTTITPEDDVEEGLTNSQAKLDAIFSQAQGKIKFVRDFENCAYTKVYVDCYQVAQVTAVSIDSAGTKISFENIKGCIDTNSDAATCDYILIEHDAVQSGDVTVNVTRNGEECDLSSLRSGDIIAYAVDFKFESGLVNPKKIDVIATTDTVFGTITAINLNSLETPDDNVYTINGTDYSLIAGELSDPDIYVQDSLIITLDPFGRIYDFELTAAAPNYAIALKLGSEDEFINLLLSDGTVNTYEVDTSKASNFYADFVDDKINNETSVADRVVTYEISSRTGKITKISKIAADRDLVDVEYKSRTSLLGSGNKILDTTPIISIDPDAEGTTLTRYSDSYSVLTKSDLLDGTTYSGYVYKIGTTITFVVLTDVGSNFNEDSQFAVAIDTPASVLTEDGDSVKAVKVLYEGEVQELYFPDNGLSDNIKGGDVFFFTANRDGYVDAIYTPTKGDPVWEDMIKCDNWSYNIWDDYTPIQFAQGVVTEITSSAISFATIEQVESGYLDMTQDLDDTHKDGIVSYGFADDCVAYTYDSDMMTRKETDKYDATSPTSIKASNFDSFDNGNGVLYDGIYQGDLMSKATTATVMIVDGEVVAIFAIER